MQIRSDSNRPLPTPLVPNKLREAQQLDAAAFGKPMAEPWTSVEDVARHLGVAKDSIYRWIDRRGLPAHRVGRHWKFKISEVDDWVRAGSADSDRKTSKEG